MIRDDHNMSGMIRDDHNISGMIRDDSYCLSSIKYALTRNQQVSFFCMYVCSDRNHLKHLCLSRSTNSLNESEFGPCTG
jgi:hypothetical protein